MANTLQRHPGVKQAFRSAQRDQVCERIAGVTAVGMVLRDDQPCFSPVAQLACGQTADGGRLLAAVGILFHVHPLPGRFVISESLAGSG